MLRLMVFVPPSVCNDLLTRATTSVVVVVVVVVVVAAAAKVAEGCNQPRNGSLPELTEGQRRRPTSLFSGMQSRVGVRGNAKPVRREHIDIDAKQADAPGRRLSPRRTTCRRRRQSDSGSLAEGEKACECSAVSAVPRS